MSKNQQIRDVIEDITSILTVENNEAISGSDLLQTMKNDFDVSPSLVARAIREMRLNGAIRLEGEGLSLTKNTVVFVKEYTAPEPTVSESTESSESQSKDNKYPFGFDIQVDYRTGKSYKRKRTPFDGEKVELDEVHKDMQKEFQRFSLALIELIPEFNGAGQHAIAILNEDPELEKFEDRNGNVYYRWNGQHTPAIMDKYWDKVQELIEAEDNDMEN